jgi:hypothetical protein
MEEREEPGQPLVLLVNPSSGGGTSLKALARVEALLDARRVPFRVVRTRSLDHGIAKALRAVESGEIPVVVSGDGMIGAIGGALAGAETPLGIVPGGRGNDLARVLGIPTEPEAARSSSPAIAARSTSARSTASASSASPASASTPTPTGSPTSPACAATSSTPGRRCGHWRPGSRPASRSRSATSTRGSRGTR